MNKAKHTKPFKRKIKVKGRQCPDYNNVWRKYSDADLQTFLVKSSHIMCFIKKRRSADAQFLASWLKVTVQNPMMSFWTVTFLIYGGIYL